MKVCIFFAITLFLCSFQAIKKEANLAAKTLGQEYYFLLHSAEYDYFYNNDLESAIVKFNHAFSLRKPFYQDYYKYIRIWYFERNFDSLTYYLEKAIPVGFPLDNKFFSDSDYSNSPPGKEVIRKSDSLHKIFLLNIDEQFTKLVEKLVGQDQILRRLNHAFPNLTGDYPLLIKKCDSLTMEELKQYFDEYGFPDLQKLNYITQNTLSVFLNHIVTTDTASVYSDPFFLLFKQQFDMGNMLPHIITAPIDYAYKIHGLQVYGTFSFSEIPVDHPHYDSLRSILGSLSTRMAKDLEIVKQKKANAFPSNK